MAHEDPIPQQTAQVQHPPLDHVSFEPTRPFGAALVRRWYSDALRLSGLHVLGPSVVLLVGGSFAIISGSGVVASAGQAVVTGAIVTAGFGWIEALGDVRAADRERQINLGSAGDLRHADLAGLELTGMYLRHASLDGARLSSARADCADLHGASLVDARLTEASLVGADLTWANLSTAGCYKANFTDADLGSATLRGARLGRAVLTGANLKGADLQEADLRGTDLSTAVFDATTKFKDAWVSDATRWPKGVTPTDLGAIKCHHTEGTVALRCRCIGGLDLVAEEASAAAEKSISLPRGLSVTETPS